MKRHDMETALINDDITTIIEEQCYMYLTDILTMTYMRMTDEEIKNEYSERDFQNDDISRSKDEK